MRRRRGRNLRNCSYQEKHGKLVVRVMAAKQLGGRVSFSLIVIIITGRGFEGRWDALLGYIQYLRMGKTG